MVAADVNGDGKTDLVLISQYSTINDEVWLSTGNGFVQDSAITLNAGSAGRSAVVADWNNDGAADLWVQTQNHTDEELLTSYQPELMTGITYTLGTTTGTTTTVTYQRINSGVTQQINGNSVPFYTKGTGEPYPRQDVNGPYYVVYSIATTGANIPMRSWEYTYAGLVRNVTGRGLLGFESIAVTDVQRNITTTTTYNPGFPYTGLPWTATSVYNPSGVTLSEVSNYWYVYDTGNSNFDLACPNQYYGANSSVAVICFLSTNVTGTDYDFLAGTTTTWKPISIYYYNNQYQGYDNSGNLLTKIVEYGSNGSDLTSTTTNAYEPESNVDFLDLTSIANVAGSSSLTRTYTFTPTGTGQVSAEDIDPNSGVDLDISYAYDGYGNVNKAIYTDPNSGSNGDTNPTRIWQYAYTDSNSGDIQGEFPYQITDPLNYSVSADYGPGSGAMTSFTDRNGFTTSGTVDSFGRPLSMTRPDGTSVDVQYLFCSNAGNYPCTNSNAVFEVVTTPKKGSSQNGAETIEYYDALGRLITKLVQGMQQNNPGCWSESDYGYDGLGYLNYQTRPYYNGSPSGCGTDTVASVTYANDPLGRVETATYYPSAREDVYAYEGDTTSVTLDAGGDDETTTTTRNAAGWITQVTDVKGGNLKFVYDAFGDPTQVTTPGNVVIANNFDIRGRKTSTTDPDMGPNGGSWAYTFDAFNELTEQISPNESAKNQSTTLAYDALGRLVSRYEPDMQSTWCYDGNGGGSCPSGVQYAKGLVTQESCSGAACVGGGYTGDYTYDDVESRPSSYAISYATSPSGTCNPCMSSETYDKTTQQLGTVTTFSGLAITYSYNSPYGYLTGITQNGTSAWSLTSLDASLRIEDESLAGGAATIARTYDPNTGNIATILGSGTSSGSLANLSLSWDNLGNLLSRQDTLNGFTDYLCYDSLNRLAYSNVVTQSESGTCNTGEQDIKTFVYDGGNAGDGNVTVKTDLGAYQYGGNGTNGAGPHAVTAINTNTVQSGGCTLARCTVDGMSNPYVYYDNDGNTQCITTASSCGTTAGRAYAWTSFDMVSGMGPGSNVWDATLTYTPEHQRASLSYNGSTMYYLNNPGGADAEEMIAGSSNAYHTYVYAYGHIVAEFLNTAGGTVTPYYFVGDHLASTTALSDGGGNQLEYDSYDAWGRRRYSTGSDEPTGCSLNPTPPSKTLRGFTGQEEIDAFCLVNLNARLYDPALGRMLTSDPKVPNTLNGQAFNRYAYVLNNPATLTDPSGYDDNDGDNGAPPVYCVDGCSYDAEQDTNDYDQLNTCGNDNVECVRVLAQRIFGALGALGVAWYELGQSFSNPLPDLNDDADDPKTKPTNNTCSKGQYKAYSAGASGTVAAVAGIEANASIGVTYPSDPNLITTGSQFFASLQISGTVGLFGYVGAGGDLSEGTNTGTMPLANVTFPYYGEADWGWGPSIGGSAEADASGASSFSLAPPVPKVGAGFGAYMGFGRAINVTLATPPIGCTSGG